MVEIFLMKYALCDFVESLYLTQNFEDAFAVFQNEVFRLGYCGVLYTHIPDLLISSNLGVQPLYKLSEGYCPAFISHYTEARFDKVDPLIRAVAEGISTPIDWWGEICEQFKAESKASREVIEVSRSYGIQNGITIPLSVKGDGIAGASIISHENKKFHQLSGENFRSLELRTQIFHNFVSSNQIHEREFIKPILDKFSGTQRRYLAGLAAGKTTSEIAVELGTTKGYLDQTMLKLRRKLSGVSEVEKPTISRNQLLYHAGLMDLLEFEIADKRG